MEKSYLTLDKISAYNKSFEFSNKVWNIAVRWDFFAKDTVGKQIVRSADSIAANIAEGFGRYGKKYKIRFYRISLGSLEETGDWIKKSLVRSLVSSEKGQELVSEVEELRIEIQHLIKYTNEKLKH